MQSADKQPVALLSLRGEGTKSKLEATVMAHCNKGPLSRSSPVPSPDHLIPGLEITMQHHPQGCLRMALFKGGAGEKHKGITIPIRFQLPAPPGEVLNINPAGIKDHAGIGNGLSRAVVDGEHQRLIQLHNSDLVSRRRDLNHLRPSTRHAGLWSKATVKTTHPESDGQPTPKGSGAQGQPMFGGKLHQALTASPRSILRRASALSTQAKG